jgi:hypothetical protein
MHRWLIYSFNERTFLMQIYMFTSESSPNLRAFAGDPSGSRLPSNHGPWNADGSIRSGEHPPHHFSRAKIEHAIKFDGFQLWRMKPDIIKPSNETRTHAA